MSTYSVHSSLGVDLPFKNEETNPSSFNGLSLRELTVLPLLVSAIVAAIGVCYRIHLLHLRITYELMKMRFCITRNIFSNCYDLDGYINKSISTNTINFMEINRQNVALSGKVLKDLKIMINKLEQYNEHSVFLVSWILNKTLSPLKSSADKMDEIYCVAQDIVSVVEYKLSNKRDDDNTDQEIIFLTKEILKSGVVL